MKMKIKKSTGKPRSLVLPTILGVIFLALASLAVAWAWHNMQESALAVESPASSNPLEQEPLPEDGDEDRTEPDGAVEEVEPAPVGVDTLELELPAGEEAPEETEGRAQFGYTLAATQPVNNEYFGDAIFFGDSITTGISLYKMMPGAAVVAHIGLDAVNINEHAVISTRDGYKTALEAALEYGDRRKVYIMLGANNLGQDVESFTDGYRAFVQAVKEQYPGAAVYLQTITPVTDQAVEKSPYATNELIEEFNLAIQDLAREQGVYFLDVAGALMDSGGRLPKEASLVDGLHFSPEYYVKWMDYLRNHAAPMSA